MLKNKAELRALKAIVRESARQEDSFLKLLLKKEIWATEEVGKISARVVSEIDLARREHRKSQNSHTRLLCNILKILKKCGHSSQEIATGIGLGKFRVEKLERYGPNGFPKKVKKLVLDRDGHRCVQCGRTRGILHIHHIRNPRNQSSSNLVCLCPICHKKADILKLANSAEYNKLVLSWGIKKQQKFFK